MSPHKLFREFKNEPMDYIDYNFEENKKVYRKTHTNVT